jgi:hypothetical protein
MTAVYVLTAGSGDTYRIERVYLDSDEAHRFAHDYNGIARPELAGVPRVEVVGLSKEKVEDCSGTRSPRSGQTWRELQGKNFRFFVWQTERNVYIGSTLPLLSVMMIVWIDAPWNGSATTS